MNEESLETKQRREAAAKQIVAKMLALFQTGHWTQRGSGVPGYTLASAFRLYSPEYDPHNIDEENDRAAIRARVTVVLRALLERRREDPHLVRWNDTPGRTREEVVELLRQAMAIFNAVVP